MNTNQKIVTVKMDLSRRLTSKGGREATKIGFTSSDERIEVAVNVTQSIYSGVQITIKYLYR